MSLRLIATILIAAVSCHYPTTQAESYGQYDKPTSLFYKVSMKYPILFNNEIPNFSMDGAVAAENFVRLTSSVPNTVGLLTSLVANPFSNWLLETSFTVYGTSNYGSDGIAITYSMKPTRSKIGGLYGISPDFDGVSVIFDSSDEAAYRSNPYIYGLVNNGSASPSFSDYTSGNVQIGSCFRDYRNSPYVTYVRLVYNDGTLTVDMDTRSLGKGYSHCFQKKIKLEKGGFFTFSSSTNTTADDHQILSTELYEIDPKVHEHVDRGYEKEDIKAGHEFKLTDEIKKEADVVHRNVEGNREKVDLPLGGHETQDSALLLTKLLENQFHLIEAVDRLDGTDAVNKYHTHSRDTNTQLTDLMKQIKDIKHIAERTEKMVDLVMKDMHLKLDKTHTIVMETLESQTKWKGKDGVPVAESQAAGGSSNLLWIGAALAGAGVLIYAISAALRGGQSKDAKKFI